MMFLEWMATRGNWLELCRGVEWWLRVGSIVVLQAFVDAFGGLLGRLRIEDVGEYAPL
jgi:hypothetical protein